LKRSKRSNDKWSKAALIWLYVLFSIKESVIETDFRIKLIVTKVIFMNLTEP
jgi:hypothetical protein